MKYFECGHAIPLFFKSRGWMHACSWTLVFRTLGKRTFQTSIAKEGRFIRTSHWKIPSGQLFHHKKGTDYWVAWYQTSCGTLSSWVEWHVGYFLQSTSGSFMHRHQTFQTKNHTFLETRLVWKKWRATMAELELLQLSLAPVLSKHVGDNDGRACLPHVSIHILT